MTLQSYTEQKIKELVKILADSVKDKEEPGVPNLFELNDSLSRFLTTAIEGAAQKVLWEAGQQVEKLPDNPMNWKEAVGSILHRTALQDEPKRKQ